MIAYFDCFSGVSGDMCLGALSDAGVPLKEIEKELRKLPVRGYRLAAEAAMRSHLRATRVSVLVSPRISKGQGGRTWRDIKKIVAVSTLGPEIKEQGLRVFRNLFEAEAAVHGVPVGSAHLHELGAVDCMVDIFGTLIGLKLLGATQIYASPLNLGGGTVRAEHGLLPVPAPATAELVRGIPVYQSGASLELTTPTGAAILKTVSAGFGPMPAFVPEKVGCGAGSADTEDRPNILRLFIGGEMPSYGHDIVTVIQTNIDDMNPQAYGYLFDRLLAAGALDMSLTPCIMKKSRPGILLTVLCRSGESDGLSELILRETTSIGVRCYETRRMVMDRTSVRLETPYGPARVKVSGAGGSTYKIMPEYEDCRALAEKSGAPILQVMEAVKAAGQQFFNRRRPAARKKR